MTSRPPAPRAQTARPMKLRTLCLALIAGLLASACTRVAAQSVPTLQAGAGGRYETQIDAKRAVPGFVADQVRAFNTRTDRLLGMLTGLSEVTEPPPGVCQRLRRWTELNPQHGVLAAELSVMMPISWQNGRCHTMTGNGVFIRVNALSLLVDPQDAHLRAEGADAEGHWYVLPPQVLRPEPFSHGTRRVFTHGRAPLFRALRMQAYLEERIRRSPEPLDPAAELRAWENGGRQAAQAEADELLKTLRGQVKPEQLARMAEAQRVTLESRDKFLREAARRPAPFSERRDWERQLAALTEAQREALACFEPAAKLVIRPAASADGADCRQVVVRLNPAYFDRRHPDRIQLLVAQADEHRTHGDDDAKLAARLRVWKAVQALPLQSLVSG